MQRELTGVQAKLQLHSYPRDAVHTVIWEFNVRNCCHQLVQQQGCALYPTNLSLMKHMIYMQTPWHLIIWLVQDNHNKKLFLKISSSSLKLENYRTHGVKTLFPSTKIASGTFIHIKQHVQFSNWKIRQCMKAKLGRHVYSGVSMSTINKMASSIF